MTKQLQFLSHRSFNPTRPAAASMECHGARMTARRRGEQGHETRLSVQAPAAVRPFYGELDWHRRTVHERSSSMNPLVRNRIEAALRDADRGRCDLVPVRTDDLRELLDEADDAGAEAEAAYERGYQAGKDAA